MKKLKPFVYINDKTKKQREFLRDGRGGGMLAELVIGTQFMSRLVEQIVLYKVPFGIVFILTAALSALFAEVINLFVRIIFGGGKRNKSYFLTAFVLVGANNCIANQGNALLPALLMSYALVLAAEVTGRCIWSLIKKREFKQVFSYVVGGISIAYLICYSVFFRNDSWGSSRIEYYNNIKETASAEETEMADGFEKYLENGDCQVGTLFYGPQEDADIITDTVDYSGFDSMDERGVIEKTMQLFSDYDYAKTPVQGRIWYPEGRSGCPVFFMVHGAHSSSVPSYLGYEYLGNYLASNGYVVVSVDENIINELGEGNDKRAILLLDNMKVLLAENKKPGSMIYGLIDSDRIAIGGHSRGGEMVATAYLFNQMDAYPEDGNLQFDYNFNISSIVAISPVVDQYMPVGRSVEISDVNYLLLHGSNDQDVSSMMGEKQYNNVTFSKQAQERFVKSAVYVLGANHGQFNSLWGRYDLTPGTNGFINTNHFLDEAEQKLVAKAYIRAFLDATVCKDDTYASLLQDISGYEKYLPNTVYVTNYENSDYVKLCSFDDTADISNCGNDVVVSVTGSDKWTLVPYERGNGGEGEDYVLSVSLEEEASAEVKVTFPGIDISDGRICFRVADMREDTENMTEGLDYMVCLTDASGNTVSCHCPELVYPSLAVQLYKQDVIFGTYEYKHQLETVMISPAEFDKDKETAFDYSDVVSLTITTNGTEAGEIIINDIGYYE